ncbi:hypothetical protein [Janthinobacterium agaricidamnosum]|uniref:Putative membrane protein n=1 Tax=Janthinobacterium agaricidamnosum NBRC 102515 = DSM 9628 TaxID=1349767 RepID=W0UWM4_9BURK|nr:hypothetical protein [Janthinobacterium agaricidamnosum]CDG80784.1 putative membrane protein [Janthinobacterium agaricidamnosum NBRC 102515 = DSM 9628]
MILPLHSMSHPYIRLRLRLAHHALLHFAASLASSAEILVALAGPVLLGLLAVIALPAMVAASQPLPVAGALILAQVLLTIAPVWLLRKRLLPHDVLLWLPALPIPPGTRWLAHIAVAGMMMAPLALAYAISVAVWLYQWPLWLRPVFHAGLIATVAALLLAWAGATLILALRARPAAPARMRRRTATAGSYRPRRTAPRALLLWRQLFWLPFWRNDHPAGMQQSALLLAAAASVLAWLWHPALVPAPLLGLCSSILLIVLTDRGDKAVREQIRRLRPLMAAWPIKTRRLELAACTLTLLPAALLLVLFGVALAQLGAGFSHKAALLYIAVAGLAQLAIVGLPRLSPRGRVALLALSILILTAIGSELWN